MQYVQDVFEAASVPVDFELIEETKNYELTVLSSIHRNGIAIKVSFITTFRDNLPDINDSCKYKHILGTQSFTYS